MSMETSKKRTAGVPNTSNKSTKLNTSSNESLTSVEPNPTVLHTGFDIQKDRTVYHPSILKTKKTEGCNSSYNFVIGADPQIGIGSANKEWDTELAYSKRAVAYINAMNPKPAFVSLCGDLVDMEPTMFTGICGTTAECVKIQCQQYDDFKNTWKDINPDIPVLCLCGNHDVGNNPTKESVERFKSKFGDDYFAFWCHSTYIICLNTNLYSDHSDVEDMFQSQHEWLKARLEYARAEKAHRVFMFGHHPWFLFDEEETEEDLQGKNYLPAGKCRDEGGFIPDLYFPVKLKERKMVLELCKEYSVDACFAGHYHQNLISATSWGMPMIVTGPICNWIIESTHKDVTIDENRTPEGPGLRIVEVDDQFPKGFRHKYHSID